MIKEFKALRKAKRIHKKQIFKDQYIPMFKDPRKFEEIIGFARLIEKVPDAESLVFDMDDSVNGDKVQEHYIGQKVVYQGQPCYITIIYPQAICISGKINGEHTTVTLKKPFPSSLVDSNKASKYILPDVDPNTIWKWMWDKNHYSYFIKFSDYEENEVNIMSRTQREDFFDKNPHYLHEFKKPLTKKSVRLNPRTLYFTSERWRVETLPEPFMGELTRGSTVIVLPPVYDVSKIEEIYLAEVALVDAEYIHLILKKSLYGKELKRKREKVPIKDKSRLFLTSRTIHKTTYPVCYYDWLAHKRNRVQEFSNKNVIINDNWENDDEDDA